MHFEDIVSQVVKDLVERTVSRVDSTHEDVVNKSYNCLKRSIHSDGYNASPIKRIKCSVSFDRPIDSSDYELPLNSDLQTQPKIRESNGVDTSDSQKSDDMLEESAKKRAKSGKQVKWRSNVVNPLFNEDSLSVMLSQTYYYFGTGIVTGEAGDMFGGNRFQGFSRHLLSDSNGIIVELCKPFIINQIIIELENKCQNKTPMFAYKVFVAIDECMTEWQLIKDCDQTVCFGQQDITFYPRIIQYIRIVGNHGLYHMNGHSLNNTNSQPTQARYFTLLNFDCIFDYHLI